MRHQVIYFLVISISLGGVSEFLPRWGKSYFQFMTSIKDQMFQFYLSDNNMREFNIPHLPMH